MTRGAISKLADRLLGKGLVARSPDPVDRRAQTLALTPAGAALVPRLAALADENDAAFFGILDPAERDSLTQLLRKLGHGNRLTGMPID
jgi:DNA-binding MarR family transcriptional regulator